MGTGGLDNAGMADAFSAQLDELLNGFPVFPLRLSKLRQSKFEFRNAKGSRSRKSRNFNARLPRPCPRKYSKAPVANPSCYPDAITTGPALTLPHRKRPGKPEGYYAPHRNAVRRPIGRSTATPIDEETLMNYRYKSKEKNG